jgi:hypothetical protein
VFSLVAANWPAPTQRRSSGHTGTVGSSYYIYGSENSVNDPSAATCALMRGFASVRPANICRAGDGREGRRRFWIFGQPNNFQDGVDLPRLARVRPVERVLG